MVRPVATFPIGTPSLLRAHRSGRAELRKGRAGSQSSDRPGFTVRPTRTPWLKPTDPTGRVRVGCGGYGCIARPEQKATDRATERYTPTGGTNRPAGCVHEIVVRHDREVTRMVSSVRCDRN